MRNAMSMRELCTFWTIQKNFKEIEKAWPDELQLKGRGHAPRSYISKMQANCLRSFGFMPRMIASTYDGKSFHWEYICPTAVKKHITNLRELGDFKP
jgi:hypothetical protein